MNFVITFYYIESKSETENINHIIRQIIIADKNILDVKSKVKILAKYVGKDYYIDFEGLPLSLNECKISVLYSIKELYNEFIVVATDEGAKLLAEAHIDIWSE